MDDISQSLCVLIKSSLNDRWDGVRLDQMELIAILEHFTTKQENIHCFPMHTEWALFTIAKIWKKHKCPSVDGWIKKMWYIYTVEYY